MLLIFGEEELKVAIRGKVLEKITLNIYIRQKHWREGVWINYIIFLRFYGEDMVNLIGNIKMVGMETVWNPGMETV